MRSDSDGENTTTSAAMTHTLYANYIFYSAHDGTCGIPVYTYRVYLYTYNINENFVSQCLWSHSSETAFDRF